MNRIRRIVEESTTWPGRVFDLGIQVVIVASIIAFSIDTLPNLSDQERRALHVFEVVTVAIFTIEYLLRVTIAERKLRFVFSFFGLVDLLAILPFYVTTGLDLRALRAVRLLRLFRILKLARYSSAARRFHLAFRLAREELVLFLSAAAVLLFLTAVGIHYFENEAQPEKFSSVFDSLWWSVATLTTVGYGDVYPVTAGGRAFTFFVLVLGLGVISVPSGLMASALSRARELESQHEHPSVPGSSRS